MNDQNRGNTLLPSGDSEIHTGLPNQSIQAKEYYEQVSAIIDAARRYRDAMRKYRAEQIAMASCGVSLEELVTMNWPRFAATQEAEEKLFEMLETLDVATR